MTDLDALEKLADEATPGPWIADITSARSYASVRRASGPPTRTGRAAIVRLQTALNSQRAEEAKADAAFIAAANPATIKALIAELKEARGLLKRWRSDLPTEALEDITDAFLARNGKGEGQ